MDIFTSYDIDFSKDFYKYLEESHNKKIQEKKLNETNNRIIKENLSNLEKCIKQNLDVDNTKSYDKTFICDELKLLLTDNNYTHNTDMNKNILQYENPMNKINLKKTSESIDDKITHHPDIYKSYDLFNSNIIQKNTYTYFKKNPHKLIIRISNDENYENVTQINHVFI